MHNLFCEFSNVSHIKYWYLYCEYLCCSIPLICRYSFATNALYIEHLTKHIGNSFSCEKCKKTFLNKTLLKNHRKKLHGDPVKCSICVKEFANTSNFQKHMREKHMAEQNFSCNVCDKNFLNAYNLKCHYDIIFSLIVHAHF